MIKTTSILIGAVLILLTIGVVMLASTSVYHAEELFGDPNHYLKRQAVWLGIGLTAGLIASRLDYRYWRKLAIPAALFSVALLAMVLLPGVGVTIKGSTRWLRFGPINFQPSELAKFASIVVLAWWMARNQRQVLQFWRGLVVPVSMLGVFCILILLEPDFGTTMLVGAVGMGIMFLGGTRVGYLLATGLGGMATLGLMIAQDPERRGRILAFLDPEKYADDEAHQLIQALLAFVEGGARGVGLGQSMQKRYYLPEAHTDFIYAIIAEEAGFGTTLFVLLLFTVILVCGLYISLRVHDRFAKLLSFGITMSLSVQALLNIGVVTGSLPTKGIALPFISFGGSSLVMSLGMVGILVNIARQTTDEFGDEERRSIKDRAHHL